MTMKVAFEVKLSSANIGALKLIRAALSGLAAGCEESARITSANRTEHARHLDRAGDAYLQIETIEAILADYEQHVAALSESAPEEQSAIEVDSLSAAAGWAANLGVISTALGNAADASGVPDIAGRVVALASRFGVPPQRLMDAMFSTLHDLPSFLGDVEVAVKQLAGDAFSG